MSQLYFSSVAMDWVVEEISAAALTFRLMEALWPGSMSGRKKVEVSLSRIRESEGGTLNIIADNEGLDSELRLTINGGEVAAASNGQSGDGGIDSDG